MSNYRTDSMVGFVNRYQHIDLASAFLSVYKFTLTCGIQIIWTKFCPNLALIKQSPFWLSDPYKTNFVMPVDYCDNARLDVLEIRLLYPKSSSEV
jgi:hypothetical protein